MPLSTPRGPTLFLKILTEGAVTTEAESLFLYLTTLTEKADPAMALI